MCLGAMELLMASMTWERAQLAQVFTVSQSKLTMYQGFQVGTGESRVIGPTGLLLVLAHVRVRWLH